MEGRNLVKFNKAKCKGLDVGWGNSGTGCPENWRNSITLSVQGWMGFEQPGLWKVTLSMAGS